ncbi:hypothetical protein EJ05DRAFT_487530 [Pseudovirgaria hyperparasitica]|uniref:Uncharacterized protein n=1 Tax=Pseudovirgaria hyperparasitica TaxID=470096 RepID=A0A6A6W3R4_9PEZI|nr:uncharacterized protein EJ05DRAFT_487530 [Pseudovirgaria hyperparasitica]KAF2756664.1 hypothetical protein EJ05DRAFT_487530 [Pseudovirgaria hyperparasitica]
MSTFESDLHLLARERARLASEAKAAKAAAKARAAARKVKSEPPRAVRIDSFHDPANAATSGRTSAVMECQMVRPSTETQGTRSSGSTTGRSWRHSLASVSTAGEWSFTDLFGRERKSSRKEVGTDMKKGENPSSVSSTGTRSRLARTSRSPSTPNTTGTSRCVSPLEEKEMETEQTEDVGSVATSDYATMKPFTIPVLVHSSTMPMLPKGHSPHKDKGGETKNKQHSDSMSSSESARSYATSITTLSSMPDMPPSPTRSEKEFPQTRVGSEYGGDKRQSRDRRQVLKSAKESKHEDRPDSTTSGLNGGSSAQLVEGPPNTRLYDSPRSNSPCRTVRKSDASAGYSPAVSSTSPELERTVAITSKASNMKRTSEQMSALENDSSLVWMTKCCTATRQEPSPPSTETPEITDDEIVELENHVAHMLQREVNDIFGKDTDVDRFWEDDHKRHQPLRPYCSSMSNYTYGKTMTTYSTSEYGETATERLSTWHWRKILGQDCLTPWRGYSGVPYPAQFDDFNEDFMEDGQV